MSVREHWEMQCPRCGHDDELEIDVVIHTTVQLLSDGTDDDGGGDREWDHKSAAHCCHCQWSGKVGQMDVAYQKAVAAIDHSLGEVDSGCVDVITDALAAHEKTPIKDLRVQLKARQKELDFSLCNAVTADQICLLKVAIAVMSTFKK